MIYTYFNHAKSVQRLLYEYEKYGSPIVACDFDDILFDCHSLGHTFDQMSDLLLECNKLGLKFVIFTAPQKQRYSFIDKHVKSLGIHVDAINESIITPHGEDTRKIYYNIFLDDRAGLSKAYEILSDVITIIKLNKLDESRKYK